MYYITAIPSIFDEIAVYSCEKLKEIAKSENFFLNLYNLLSII